MHERITVVTYGYPCSATPTAFPFVKELVEQWRQQCGVQVKVINPLTFSNYRKCRKENGKDGVYHPLYFIYRFLKVFPFLRKLQTKLADRSFQKAVSRVLDDGDTFLYAHFLNAGLAVANIASQRQKCRTCCAFGESSLWSLAYRDKAKCRKVLQKIEKFVSVSTQNANLLVEEGIADSAKIITLPNGIDSSKFHREDKKKCREELNLPTDEIIGVFVGHFIERKGPKRVAAATDGIPHLKMIYIGAGEDVPEGDNIVFRGRVEHDLVGRYLSAADFFILPTLAEGCCNAIVEAMACGLPIISSVGEFNDDILSASNSIRIDPKNVDEIRDAVLKLVNDSQLRNSMAASAIETARELSIENRAKKILQWMYLERIDG